MHVFKSDEKVIEQLKISGKLISNKKLQPQLSSFMEVKGSINLQSHFSMVYFHGEK